eukprot:gnl/TRDRNA2_/TRDRNA2_159591_c0_seq3.p1 gnl/TRDRNA2_/TRDRNA2_159591_c0~~gnl/TRDRNA2_/TRDRNA2_159591_c0_seq3.p1  ORF type:complete len:181 (+),score=30.78 gnl/TRDRNA2_/TRDRNA2_159591_c0_seq3:237-779(+)
MLAMAFVNALNEAARDSDVIRMFSRGKGYMATVKCQNSFRFGTALDLCAILTVVHSYIGWEVLVLLAVALPVAVCIYVDTAHHLFNSASLVSYWRRELGGDPDDDDPYDLSIPLEQLRKKVESGRELIAVPSADEVSDDLEAAFTPAMAQMGPSSYLPLGRSQVRIQQARGARAALAGYF